MKIVILQSAQDDLRWYRQYYDQIFREGRKNGRARYVAATRVLLDNPFAGAAYKNAETRKFSIAGTPFHFIYRVTGNQIQIIQIKDARGMWPQAPEASIESE